MGGAEASALPCKGLGGEGRMGWGTRGSWPDGDDDRGLGGTSYQFPILALGLLNLKLLTIYSC